MKWLRNLVKVLCQLYDIEDLQVGGYCGTCGVTMQLEIVPKNIPWSICDKCAGVPKIVGIVNTYNSIPNTANTPYAGGVLNDGVTQPEQDKKI